MCVQAVCSKTLLGKKCSCNLKIRHISKSLTFYSEKPFFPHLVLLFYLNLWYWLLALHEQTECLYKPKADSLLLRDINWWTVIWGLFSQLPALRINGLHIKIQNFKHPFFYALLLLLLLPPSCYSAIHDLCCPSQLNAVLIGISLTNPSPKDWSWGKQKAQRAHHLPCVIACLLKVNFIGSHIWHRNIHAFFMFIYPLNLTLSSSFWPTEGFDPF